MLKNGGHVSKIEDVPEKEHWQLITLKSRSEDDGYGGSNSITCPEIQIFYDLIELEKQLAALKLDRYNDKPYWVQHVNGRAKITTTVKISIQ